ncbi:hypothetical protein GGI25_000329 [Coemansia spiralis]|uniref:Uncharacterized protein n=2 Tax=Coemansia TaxID=4863 RepID=A0A9W8G828_9FUNG|nr:hypothetical protein EDC05_000156 [Coemansia umbellata]KAJ2625976.1 hypothetical protein GGI26_000060 [Coemansia sp. RSA 1358]KAJ2680694.1 hypothetical protein GGI25_000329 [Coemansia spiralis]
MSQFLSQPWLTDFILANKSQIGQNITKGGRRVQAFQFKDNPDDQSLYKLTCEISDKHNFMRAALSPKSLDRLKSSAHLHINDIAELDGMIVQIKSCTLMFHSNSQPNDLRKRNKKKKVKAARHICPQRIANAGCPQFWLLITDFTYMGGRDSSIFNQPNHVKFNKDVSELMKELISKELESSNAKQTGKASKSPSIEQLQAQIETSDPQQQQQNTASLPTIAQLPFITDMEAAWSCPELWANLAIQQACVHLMPVCGIQDVDLHDHVSVQEEENEQPRTKRQKQRHNSSTDNSITAMESSIVKANTDSTTTLHRDALMSKEESESLDSELNSRLGRVLIPDDSGLVISETIMDILYGSISSSPGESSDAESQMGENPKTYNADELLNDSVQWDQDNAFSIH